MKILELHDVEKSFTIPSVRRQTVREHLFGLLRRRSFRRLEVLRGVSFDVEAGQTVGLMGRNGSGKSTLLKIMCGVYEPHRGQVIRRGVITPILELGVGWNPELSARDNVLLLGTVMGMRLSEVTRALDEVLDFAELESFADLQVKHFSSGMASRLAYSVAFKAVREILLLDEVVAVGDASFRAKCLARFHQLAAAGHTVILVSHEPTFVATECPRALLLDGGRIVLDASGPEVADAYLRLNLGEPAAAAEISVRASQVTQAPTLGRVEPAGRASGGHGA